MKRIILLLIIATMITACTESNTKKASQEKEEQQQENIAENQSKSYNAILTDSIANDTMNVTLYVRRAQSYLNTERIGLAIQDINKALSLDGKNIDALLVLSDIYYSLGDQDNILLTLNKANEIAPLDPRPVVKLSELSFLQGNSQLALAYTDKALELDKFNPRAYFMRGMIFLAQNDTTLAMKNLMLARHQDEMFYEPLLQIAAIYAAQRNPIAEDFYREAIQRFPENYTIYYDLAMFLQDNGKPEEALICYDTLLKKEADNSQLYYNKGYVNLVYLFNYDEALELFDKALELNPSSVDAMFNKGRTLEQKGDYRQAKSIYLQILKNNPNYQMAIDAIHRIGD